MAEVFIPEDNSQWSDMGDDRVFAKRGKTVLAEVEVIEGSRCHIVIPSWEGLIRTAHLHDFNPAIYGMVVNTSEDVLFGEKYPDSEGEVDFGYPPNLDMPAQIMPRETRYKAPKVVM
jgi:hypothetical protein